MACGFRSMLFTTACLVCCGGRATETTNGGAAETASGGAASSGAAGAAGVLTSAGFPGASGSSTGGPGSACVDTVPCVQTDRWDATLCKCVPNDAQDAGAGGNCATSADCAGPLPNSCALCPDGLTACAHYECTTGKCEIATCGPDGQPCGPGTMYLQCPAGWSCLMDENQSVGRCIIIGNK